MLSYITSVFRFFFANNTDDDDSCSEDYLTEQLFDLELAENAKSNVFKDTSVDESRNTVCFQRSGTVTYIDENFSHILIDGSFYHELISCNLHLNVNDKIVYLGYKNSDDKIVIVRILENIGPVWSVDDNDVQEDKFQVFEHVIIGEVDCRQERFVYIKDTDLKFNLDEVEGTFVPIKGDWLELKCSVQWNDKKPSDISAEQVLQVKLFKALRTKVMTATVTDLFGDSGICDRKIYFEKNTIQYHGLLQVGSKVLVEGIESNQGTCVWRALKLVVLEETAKQQAVIIAEPNEDELSLKVEKEMQVEVTHPLKFDKVNFHETKKLTLNVANNSEHVYTMNKWILLTRKKDSQIEVKPFINKPVKLYPGNIHSFTVTCRPKFLGSAKECLIIMFKGFQVKRFIEINVFDTNYMESNVSSMKTDRENKHESMIQLRKNQNRAFVPGVKTLRSPNFVSVKLGYFPIPDRVWAAVLGDSEQTIHSFEYDKILERIENCLPCLTQDLNINNYIDRWHTLIYMEEIQANINMRVHDKDKVFLIHVQEYLGVEMIGLAEARPSIIIGDRVMVKDTWSENSTQYEGYVHALRGNLVLIKFTRQFHETYNGSDVSIEFHFSRAVFRRAHQAINLALSNLGPDILFPSRILKRPLQVERDRIKNIKWFNEKLNNGQKSAVTNILLGESRPIPYCIYGPPGTGKTVTVVETILQILTLLPDSRILVATPSNSAANLITERLLDYRNVFSDSIVRLIANYLATGENLPDAIKPFCATLDIARENTAKSKYRVQNGINMHCRASFVGRHRVTIATCYCIGNLAQMELPRGHFTHIVVDEAGQATEPEIMIPMSFIDKDNSQIILAGDPKQLGPVVMSKYCTEMGLGESYLSRILETFPYQIDYEAFESGFNPKLVSKLSENYRSLEEVLALPSEMFYNSSLVMKINKDQKWITRILNAIAGFFNTEFEKSSGIYVYGIRGCNTRAHDSPSWYNPQEASMIALTTCQLYKKDVHIDDIGIITPYVAQIKYLRLVFDGMGLPQPKIGTVEEFQGQERPIILISTVRSTQSYLGEDTKHTLGFVKNPKRVNVSLTRAQVAVILFCNPHLLCTDPLWRRVIEYADKHDKYTGCELPPSLINHSSIE